MRKAIGLLSALGLVALTAGCVQDYPSSAYSPGYATGYNTAYSPGYTSGYNTAAYSPAYTGYSTSRPAYTTGTAYSSAYTPPAYTAPASRSERYWNSANRDADRDGIPNRYDRDANGDGIPDRYQGRPAPRY